MSCRLQPLYVTTLHTRCRAHHHLHDHQMQPAGQHFAGCLDESHLPESHHSERFAANLLKLDVFNHSPTFPPRRTGWAGSSSASFYFRIPSSMLVFETKLNDLYVWIY
jgi:hypothetical protein